MRKNKEDRLFENMNEQEKRQFSSIVRLLVRHLREARFFKEKVKITFKYREGKKKSKWHDCQGQLMYVDFPHLSLKESDQSSRKFFDIKRINLDTIKVDFVKKSEDELEREKKLLEKLSKEEKYEFEEDEFESAD